MKHSVKLLPLILALLLLVLSLAGCGPALPRLCPVARVTQTTTYEFFQSEREPVEATTVTEYDEKGLATRLDISMAGESIPLELRYSFDEQGNPVLVSTLVMGQELVMTLENRYEDGKLREAVITDLQLEGESLLERLAEESSALTASISGVVFRPVERFIGYRSCTLRLAGSEDRRDYENGRQVYSLMGSGNLKIETLTDYGTGGAVTTTIRYLSASDGTLQNGTVTETDGENLLRRLEMTGPGGEKLSLSFRCEEGEKDGQRVKYAYLDDITASGSEEVLERAAELETVKGQPFGEYLLDEKGRVSSCTLHQGLLTPEEEFSQEWSRLFDAAGRELRSEQRLQTADLLSITVTETEYR